MIVRTALVVPCAGSASRFGAPWPKEAAMPEPDRLLIDYALEAGLEAGIDRAYLVVSEAKLRPLSAVLGPSRLGLQLTYVLVRDSDYDCEGASVVRGCVRATMADGYRRYAVAYPDVQLEHPQALKRLSDECGARPGLWYPAKGLGGPALAVMDMAASARVKRLVTSGALERTFWQLAEQDAEASGCWVKVADGHYGAWDVNEVDDLIDAGMRARDWR